MPDQLRFVILEKDAFIAQDMCMGLIGAAPGCDTLVVSGVARLQGALDALPDDRHDLVVITASRIEVVEQTGLDKMVARVSGRLVLREGADSNQAVRDKGWLTLANPFTDDALAELVQTLTRHRNG